MIDLMQKAFLFLPVAIYIKDLGRILTVLGQNIERANSLRIFESFCALTRAEMKNVVGGGVVCIDLGTTTDPEGYCYQIDSCQRIKNKMVKESWVVWTKITLSKCKAEPIP
ncbi:hypothetical protein CLV98_1264 [Dyadobacter jejuensis]|uniref:Uncharacterized protein n=2 Tax=Dyadobacter jejuensis TaxID=1082580 RepID=A0A316A5Y4_9BACT|nr:hypothetical protein CLV98_1264 [Dyadobacter jejuensis]